MKRKFNAIIIVCLFFISTTNVSATSGRLKGASIEECNGTFYGNHGDGHWHEGKQNDGGTWSAIGQPLGFTSPCGTYNEKDEDYVVGSNNGGSQSAAAAYSAPVETEAEKEARYEEERKAEEARIKEEKLEEEERLKQEKLEQERIEKEKEEAQKQLERETSIKVNTVSIDGYDYKMNEIDIKKMFIIHSAVVPVKVDFTDKLGLVESQQNKELDYFEYGVLDLDLASYNKKQRDSKQINVLRLPDKATVQTSDDFGILINDRTLNYQDNLFKLSYEEYMGINPHELIFTYKDTEVPIDYKITIKETEDKEKIFVVKLPEYETTYEFPVIVSKKPLGGFVLVSSVGLGTLATGLFHYKKR